MTLYKVLSIYNLMDAITPRDGLEMRISRIYDHVEDGEQLYKEAELLPQGKKINAQLDVLDTIIYRDNGCFYAAHPVQCRVPPTQEELEEEQRKRQELYEKLKRSREKFLKELEDSKKEKRG